MSDTSTAEHPGEAVTEDHSHSGVAHGSLASISENEAQNETKDVLSPEVVAAIRASEEEPFTSDNEHANNSSHRNGYSSEDPPQQIVSREMLRRNRDELVFRPQQTTHKSPPLGRGLRSQPRPSIHNLSSDGGNVSFVEQSQHYARRSSYEDPVVKIRHPRQQQYHQFENQPSEHEGDDQYNYHPSQFQHTYPPNRREHPQHIQPQSGDFGHKRRGNDQGRFQHATTYGASREADMFNTPKYGRLTSKAKDSDLETSGYNNQFRVKFADEVFGDRQGRPLAPHYQEGFPNRLPLEEVVGTAPWQERRISSHSSVDISATSRSSIDGTFISETANSIRRQLRTSNWPAFARSPNHEQSYLPRKRQAALMSILLLMVLFMMLRHGPENLTMYTTVGDESPADKINELRPARGIMDDFNPSMRSIQNNPVKPVPESSVVDGKDEEVFDWSKVPPHLRGYYKTMLENAPKIGIEEIPRIIPKLDASQFEMQQSLLAQNGGFSEGTEVGLMKKQTHPDAVQELLQLNEGIDDEKRLIQEAESDGRLQSLAAEEFGQDANLQSISEEKPVSEDLLELARQQHAEIERAEAERFESNQLSQQEFEAAQTMLEIADEVMNDAPAMPLVPELASKEVIDDMALEEVGQNKVDPILNEEKQVVLAEQSAQDIPPDEVLSTQSTEEKEEESAGDGESDAIGEKRETTPTELEEELLRKEREDERKRQRQDETKALQIELADLMNVLEKKKEK
mmetsp:Transcript_21947/g.49746  ORF Transcript_21947/g.49746 Transcript_21947/m.49746 type:complete len:741 (-) Transcript_21947:71-2293(-)